MAPPRPKPGTRRLSEVARHLVAPTGIVRTYWNAVRDQCADLGLGFDRWQDGAGRLILAQREDGQYACGIGGAVLSWPRQVGKTYLIGAIIIALCLLRPGRLALWTAHHGKTINETFLAMQAMTRRKKIFPHVKRIITGNGDEAIEFRNGSRILFGAREHGFGLGFTGVSLLVFDEAQRVTQRAVTTMVPTANTGDNPLVFFIGTPPGPEDRGEVFTARRKKALKIELEMAADLDPESNLLYIELSADPKTSKTAIDWHQVANANPSYPHRTNRASIERMWELLGPDDFWREGYGIWDEVGFLPPEIMADVWDPLAIPPAGAPTDGNIAYGVKFSPDGSRYGVSVGLAHESGVHVEAFPPTPMGQGLTPLADWLAERWRGASVIALDGKAGVGDLVNLLRKRGVPSSRMVVLSTDQAVAANGTLVRHVNEGTLTHLGQPGLTMSVSLGARRTIGTVGGWGFSPATPDADVTPVESAAIAVWGATTGRKPMTGQGRTSGSGRRSSSGRQGVVS